MRNSAWAPSTILNEGLSNSPMQPTATLAALRLLGMAAADWHVERAEEETMNPMPTSPHG